MRTCSTFVMSVHVNFALRICASMTCVVGEWLILTLWMVNNRIRCSLYYVLNENKWIFLNEVPVVARKATFDKKWYYEQIRGGEIGKNPNLIRNDGY